MLVKRKIFIISITKISETNYKIIFLYKNLVNCDEYKGFIQGQCIVDNPIYFNKFKRFGKWVIGEFNGHDILRLSN